MKTVFGLILGLAVSANVSASIVESSLIFDELSEDDLCVVSSFLPNMFGEKVDIIIQTHRNETFELVIGDDVHERGGLECAVYATALESGAVAKGSLCDNNGKWLFLDGDDVE